MSTSAEDEPTKPYDRFELATAILLGLAAIGAAVAGQQAGQWGGRQLDAFAEANTLTTKASTQYNENWALLGMGSMIFLATAVFMATLPWAG